MPRFTLRTLFVAIALIAAVLGWCIWQQRLVRERGNFLKLVLARGGGYAVVGDVSRPAYLWIDGLPAGQVVWAEQLASLDDKILANRPSRYRAWLNDRTIGEIKIPRDLPEEIWTTAETLFPEATIKYGGVSKQDVP